MITRHRAIALVLCVLTIAQFIHVQSDFADIDTAEKLIEEYEQLTLIGVALFLVCGLAASLMAYIRASGWRLGALVAVALYVWAVWYPDFLRLVFKYGLSTVVVGIYENALASGTLGSVLLHSVLYPLGFTCVLLAVIWDFKAAGQGD